MKKNDKSEYYLNIPKRHTLKFYMQKVCELYGETKPNTEAYIEDQLLHNETQLDSAIECFKEQLENGKKV